MATRDGEDRPRALSRATKPLTQHLAAPLRACLFALHPHLCLGNPSIFVRSNEAAERHHRLTSNQDGCQQYLLFNANTAS
ncbi:hypothetical protein PsYK624_073200 [Phanerochaete sordida]|uniref:Uncharacterized protein n=1 Tax=Phanerochaete sordida TaxID=48140 RepID=A0A9P3GAE9_9APHY|nr:hypothetical protein PsYK624_073200 [Phanerochaete sordida]